jgi:hypothetical protein
MTERQHLGVGTAEGWAEDDVDGPADAFGLGLGVGGPNPPR